jgi:hypothetical protein
MKIPFIWLALLGGAVGGYAQGTVNFNTYLLSFNIAVWSPQTGPLPVQRGNTATDIPAGTTVYNGVPLGGAGASAGTSATSYGNGNDYSLALYAAPGLEQALSLSDGSPDLVTVTHFYTAGGTGAANVINGPNTGMAGGWIGNPDLPIPGTVSGTAGQATVELVAWYNDSDTITSYADAVADGVPNGQSDIANLNGLGGLNVSRPPSLPVPLIGITSFALGPSTVVSPAPEPGAIALGFIGACAFLLRRRIST